MIAVDRRVRYPIHYDQRTRKSLSGQILEIVVPHGLARIDNADTSRIRSAISIKEVVLNQGIIAVAQGECTTRPEERVPTVRITA